MVILCVWGGSFRPSENDGIITACMRYGFALCQKRAGAWAYAFFRRPPVLFAALPLISFLCLIRGRLKNLFCFSVRLLTQYPVSAKHGRFSAFPG